jgi:hypothetical protein
MGRPGSQAEKKAPPRGREPLSKTTEKTAVAVRGGAESGALLPLKRESDLGLKEIIDAWRTLAEDVQAAILAKVRATGGSPGDHG